MLSVAFGTVEHLFRTPLPVYQPWWWDFATFRETLEQVLRPDAIYLSPLLRTLVYVVASSLICLVHRLRGRLLRGPTRRERARC